MSLNRNNPGVSSLLLSEPFMLDPNFQRSVVLLCEHDPQQGTLGYIVNQPTGLTIGDLIGELSGCDLPLFVGGPVEQNTLHFVHKYGALIPDGTELGRGLYWGGDFDEIKHLLSSGVLTSNDIKFFIGYCGWNPGQLEEEFDDNSWVVSNDYHPDLIFLEEREDVWKEALIAMGPKFAHVANFPVNPQWN